MTTPYNFPSNPAAPALNADRPSTTYNFPPSHDARHDLVMSPPGYAQRHSDTARHPHRVSPHGTNPSYSHHSPPRTPVRNRDTSDYGYGATSGSDFNSGISTGFIEAVAQSMGFTESDQEYRTSLHSIPKIGTGMPRGDLQLQIYQTALLFAVLKECRALADSIRTDRAMMADLHIRLEETFNLTQEQRANVRLVTGELLLDPNRVRYVRMNIDVEVKLRDRQKELRLFNIFGNLSRQRLLSSAIRRACSSLRNAYREMLRDSVIGNNTQTLDDFVCQVANRFFTPSSGRHTLGSSSIAHIALLRRFALENPQILGVGEDEDDDDDHPSSLGDSGRTTSAALDGDTEDGSRPSSAMSIGPTPRGKKRKRGPATPAPSNQRGNDFWSSVDKWFAARMRVDQLGTPWTSPGWIKYIEETLEQDRSKFTCADENQYEDNFTALGCVDNSSGGSIPGNLIGAVGSMAGILEHV